MRKPVSLQGFKFQFRHKLGCAAASGDDLSGLIEISDLGSKRIVLTN